MSKPGRWQCLLILGAVCGPARAHGEEMLMPIFAQLASLALCALALLTWRRARGQRLAGLIACVTSTAIVLWAVAGLPYRQYLYLVTVAAFVVPLAATVSAIYLTHARRAKQRKQRARSAARKNYPL